MIVRWSGEAQVNVSGMSGKRQISIWAWHWWTWNLFLFTYLTVNLFIQLKPSINLGHIWSSSCLQKVIFLSSIDYFPFGSTSRTPSPGPSCLWPGWGGQCTGPSRLGSTAPSPWGCSPPSLRSGLRSRKLICIKYHKYLPKIARGEYFPPGPTSMVSGRQGRIFLHYFFQEDHFWFSLFTQVTQFKMVSIDWIKSNQ